MPTLQVNYTVKNPTTTHQVATCLMFLWHRSLTVICHHAATNLLLENLLCHLRCSSLNKLFPTPLQEQSSKGGDFGSSWKSLSSWSVFTGLFSCLLALWNLAEMGFNTLAHKWVKAETLNLLLSKWRLCEGAHIRYVPGWNDQIDDKIFVSLIVFLQNLELTAAWKSCLGNVWISHHGEQNWPSTQASL